MQVTSEHVKILAANAGPPQTSKNASPLMRKKLVSPICRREKVSSLSRKIRGLQSCFEPKGKLARLKRINMFNLTQRRAKASQLAKQVPSSFQHLKIRRNVSFLNQTGKPSKPEKRKNALSKLKKFHSKSTKKKLTRSIHQHINRNKIPESIRRTLASKRSAHMGSKKEEQSRMEEAKDSILITQYQSLESKSISETNSRQGKLGLSRTETGSFFNGKAATSEDTMNIQNNIFYQNSNSRENNGQSQTKRIQIFNNQVNKYEIKISQHFVGQPPLQSMDKDKLLSSHSAEQPEKKVIFSNFNNNVEEPFSPNPPPKKKHKIKNLSLNLKGLYFDLPSMRNLKTSDSGQYLPSNSHQDDPGQHTRSPDSKGDLTRLF